MIRINLAKSSSFMNAGGASKPLDLLKADLDIKIEWIHIKKLLIVFIFVAVVIAYEKYNAFILKKSLRASITEMGKVQQEIGKFGNISSVIEDLIKEKEKMNMKLEIIGKISRQKTLKINTLLAIQERIPEDLWLKGIVFKEDKVSFNGYSKKTSYIEEAIKNLKEAEFIESAAISGEMKKSSDSKIEKYEFGIDLKLKE